MIELSVARKVSDMLAALGEPTRMKLIEQLTEGPQYVGHLAQVLKIPLVNVSHHLGVLRSAGLLDYTKEGRRVSYAINPQIFTPSTSADSYGTLAIGPYTLTIVRKPNDVSKRGKAD